MSGIDLPRLDFVRYAINLVGKLRHVVVHRSKAAHSKYRLGDADAP
jgi:hypothetical protein